MGDRWRCILIGSESLLIQCGQILERAGHSLAALASREPEIVRWAAERGIRVVPSASELLDLNLGPVDYLFSIANLSILPPAVIQIGRASCRERV